MPRQAIVIIPHEAARHTIFALTSGVGDVDGAEISVGSYSRLDVDAILVGQTRGSRHILVSPLPVATGSHAAGSAGVGTVLVEQLERGASDHGAYPPGGIVTTDRVTRDAHQLA